MKKLFTYMMMGAMLVCSTCTLTSCLGDEEEEEVIEKGVQEQYINDIVGYWLQDGTQEYWRFDPNGQVTRINGEYWDEADEMYEGWSGTNKFNWTINELGVLSVIIQLESSEAVVPDPDLMLIKSITETKMTWVTNNGKGKQQTLTRVKEEDIKKIPEEE